MKRAPWLLGFLAYWLVYAEALVVSRPDTTWALACRGAAFTVAPQALLALAALALVRRVPWVDGARARFLLLHLAGGLVFTGLAIGTTAAAFAAEGRVVRGAWEWPASLALLIWMAIMAFIVYCAVCSIAHAGALAARARAEVERAARAETLRAEARLAALRAQLNPHFILNLLHSLLGMVGRDPEAAAAGLERLGDLLRYTLRVQRQEGDQVPLGDELAFVEDYLALERLRLGERLRVELSVAPRLADRPVPAFILQPLVENAVRHGIAPRADGGKVRVTIEARDGELRLGVRDDGLGPGTPAASQHQGLGLRLIRERLTALYGERARLEAGPVAGGGFAAAVSIPLGRAGEEADS